MTDMSAWHLQTTTGDTMEKDRRSLTNNRPDPLPHNAMKPSVESSPASEGQATLTKEGGQFKSEDSPILVSVGGFHSSLPT